MVLNLPETKIFLEALMICEMFPVASELPFNWIIGCSSTCNNPLGLRP